MPRTDSLSVGFRAKMLNMRLRISWGARSRATDPGTSL